MTAQIPQGTGTIAMLQNVANCMVAMERLISRSPGRPGIGVFHGPSGYGKTYAAIYVQNKFRAARVEVGESWSRKVLLEKICVELHVEPKGTMSQLVDRTIEALVDEDRPLIIDEADKLCDKNMIELIREIGDQSAAPIMLLGEEKLPGKLAQVERVHNRVLVWEPAQPCGLQDARALASLTCKVEIADDLLAEVLNRAGGRARRIINTLDYITEFCRNTGRSSLSLADYEGDYDNGYTPRARGVA